MGQKENPLVWYYEKDQHFAELLKQIEQNAVIDTDTYEVIADYAGVPEFRRIKENHQEGEKIKMCNAIRILMEESRQEGIYVGQEQQKKETELQMKRADEAIEQWKAAEQKIQALVQELEELKKLLAEKSS